MQRASLKSPVILLFVAAASCVMLTCSASAEPANREGGPGHLYLMEGDGMMLRRQNVTLETLGAELRKRHVPAY